MTFKKLVQEISKIKSYEDCVRVSGMIDRSFETEKTTWKDHETLWDIIRVYYDIYQN